MGNQQTKYYALQILESVIKTRWKVLPRNQCDGIKKYIVGLIIKTSSDQELMEKEKTYLNKLNMILVQVRHPVFSPIFKKISLILSRSAHRTPNFTNPKFFICLLFKYFFQIK